METYGHTKPGTPGNNDPGGLSKLEGVFHAEMDVKYIFIQGRADSQNLAIGFSDIPEVGSLPGYQHVKDLAGIDCHKLFILDDFGARASYYACRGKRFEIERSVTALISKIITRNEIETVLSFGQGAGASAALYYGFKYGFDHVIASSPQYFIGTYLYENDGLMDIFKFMAEGYGEGERDFLNKILPRAISSSGSTPIIHLIYSENGAAMKGHIKPLIRHLDKNEIRYVLDTQGKITDDELARRFPEKLRGLVAKCFRYPQISVKTTLENGYYIADVTCDDSLTLGYELFVDKQSVAQTLSSFKRNYSFRKVEGRDYKLKITALNSQGNVLVETVRFKGLREQPLTEEFVGSITEDFTKAFAEKPPKPAAEKPAKPAAKKSPKKPAQKPVVKEPEKPIEEEFSIDITDDLAKLFEELDEYDGGVFSMKSIEDFIMSPPEEPSLEPSPDKQTSPANPVEDFLASSFPGLDFTGSAEQPPEPEKQAKPEAKKDEKAKEAKSPKPPKPAKTVADPAVQKDREELRAYLNGIISPELLDFDFKIKHLLRKWSDTKDVCIDVAKKALKGVYKVYVSIDPSKPKTVRELWTSRVEPVTTYCTYLYSLTIVSRLINACKHTGDDRYFQKALELVTSFIEFANSKDSEKALRLQHEFSVAGRIIVLTEFVAISVKMKKTIPPVVLRAIKDHIIQSTKFLLGDVYTQNNHGLWQNNALLVSALVLKKDAYVSKKLNDIALSRLVEQMNDGFTKDGVSVENSSFYHFYNLNVIRKTKLFIENNKINVSGFKESFMDFFALAEEVGGHFIRQDKHLPFDGDTESKTYKDREFIPKNAFFRNSNLVILKNEKAYILTRAGNKTLTHKHRDDMALTLFYDNREFILDAGKYNYEYSSKEREYIVSALAHSTIVVDDSDYPLKKAPDCDIVSSGEKSGCAWVKMYNNQYEGVKLTRTLIWLEPNLIFLSDHCESEAEHKYTQNYLLSDFAEIQRYDQGIIMESEDVHFSVRQLDGEPHNCRIFHGDNETLRGKVSYKYQQMTDRYNVAFEKNGNQVSFYTCIEVHTGVAGELTLDSIGVDGDSYTFSCLNAKGEQSSFNIDA